jgi:hypothetical protein
MAILQSHIVEHIGLQAREEVEEEMRQVIEQKALEFGGQLPPEAQQAIQEQIEQQVAEKISSMIEEMVGEEQEILAEEGQDPLISLKAQELQLKAQDIQRKAMDDESRRSLDKAKLNQNAKLTQDKIDSQEDIAQLRANVNLSKQKQ